MSDGWPDHRFRAALSYQQEVVTVTLLLLTLPDGTRKIVSLPHGNHPEQVAERHGASLFDLCSSPEEAQRRLSRDPNGKVIWY